MNLLFAAIIAVILATGAKAQIKVSQTGKVGINLAGDATEALEINGNALAGTFKSDVSSGDLFKSTNSGYQTINLSNDNILGINTLQINDIGPNEGIDWKSGRNISVLSTTYGGYDGFRFLTTTDFPFVFLGGKVGIGKTNPEHTLDVAGDVQCNNMYTTSDERLKENIQDFVPNLNALKQLRPVTYKMKRPLVVDLVDLPTEGLDCGLEAAPDTAGLATEPTVIPIQKTAADTGRCEQIGFLAQELETVFPNLVHTDKNGYKSVNYIALIPVLVAAVKEQQGEIEGLKAIIQKEQAKENGSY